MIVEENYIRYYKDYSDQPYNIRDHVVFDTTSMLRIEQVRKSEVVFSITLPRRELKLRTKDFVEGLAAVLSVIRLFEVSDYASSNLNGSFAPVRKNCEFESFIDGEGYFESLFASLEEAKKEVLICGWMISPEMPLLRPVRSLENEKSRLDKTLVRAAERGVSVYILVYKEFNVSMYNDSEHVRKSLHMAHPRIKVMRHPNQVISLWSHHEKMVVVDREAVYMGGLDLAWGRWDTQAHPLLHERSPGGEMLFPGVDYYNPMIKEMHKGRWYKKSLVMATQPRMPWHDVAVVVRGGICKDFVNHFITYWNHSRETRDEPEVLFTQIVEKDSNGEPRKEITQIENVPKAVRELFSSKNIDSMILKTNLVREPEEDIKELVGGLLNQYAGEEVESIEGEEAMSTETEEDEENSMEEEVNDEMKQKESCIDQEENREMILMKSETSNSKKILQESYDMIISMLDNAYKRKTVGVPFEKNDSLARPGLPKSIRKPNINNIENESRKVTDWIFDNMSNFETVFSQKGGDFNDWYQTDSMKSKEVGNIQSNSTKDKIETKTVKNQSDSKFYSKQSKGHATQRFFDEVYNVKNLKSEEISIEPYFLDKKLEKRLKLTSAANLNFEGREEMNEPEPLMNQKSKQLLEVCEMDHPEIMKADSNSLMSQPIIYLPQDTKHRGSILMDIFRKKSPVKMQLLRSASSWSIGLRMKECSILNGYIKAILNSKRFIYIENQFFISSTSSKKMKAEDNTAIRNRIVKAIYMRIRLAVKRRENFKVIIFLPLLPAFEADLEKKQGEVMQVQLGLENSTVMSLVEKVKQIAANYRDYIMVCGLRKFEEVPGRGNGNTGSARAITNLIYIHSKAVFPNL